MERMERRMAEMEKELQKYRNMVAEVRASPSPTRGVLFAHARDTFHVVCGPVSSLGACVFPRDMVRVLARARAGERDGWVISFHARAVLRGVRVFLVPSASCFVASLRVW